MNEGQPRRQTSSSKEFLSEQTSPAVLECDWRPLEYLWNHYKIWCGRRGKRASSRSEFVTQLMLVATIVDREYGGKDRQMCSLMLSDDNPSPQKAASRQKRPCSTRGSLFEAVVVDELWFGGQYDRVVAAVGTKVTVVAPTESEARALARDRESSGEQWVVIEFKSDSGEVVRSRVNRGSISSLNR